MRASLCAALLVSLPALAYVQQRNFAQFARISATAASGTEVVVHWPIGTQVSVSMHQFAGTLANGSALSASDARTVVGTSLAQWTGSLLAGLSASLSLSLDTGGVPHFVSNNCEFTSSGGADGVNNILFTSKASGTSCVSSLTASTGVIGITRVRFSAANGEIAEADIQFDDSEFLFTNAGTNDTTASPAVINLKDVATHELGHLFWPRSLLRA